LTSNLLVETLCYKTELNLVAQALRFARGCEYGSDILLKSIKYIVSFVNSLPLYYKRHNQNKADSEVKKTRPLAWAKLETWVKSALCFIGVLSAWFQF